MQAAIHTPSASLKMLQRAVKVTKGKKNFESRVTFWLDLCLKSIPGFQPCLSEGLCGFPSLNPLTIFLL